MKYRVLFSFLLTVLFVMASGCGSVKNCPVCGTTTADGYTNIDVILVPEHNPTGEPGGPFNSFDISVVDPVSHRFFVSDRVGLDVAVIDTNTDIAVNAIEGVNGVAGSGKFSQPVHQGWDRQRHHSTNPYSLREFHPLRLQNNDSGRGDIHHPNIRSKPLIWRVSRGAMLRSPRKRRESIVGSRRRSSYCRRQDPFCCQRKQQRGGLRFDYEYARESTDGHRYGPHRPIW